MLATAPEEVVLTFSEPIVSVPDGVTVFAAERRRDRRRPPPRGTPTWSSSLDGDGRRGHGGRGLARGVRRRPPHRRLPQLLGRRAERDRARPGRGGAPTDGVPVALSVVRWVGYAGLLLAVGPGLVRRPAGPPARRRCCTAGARGRRGRRGVVAAAAWLVGLPLTGAYQRGRRPRRRARRRDLAHAARRGVPHRAARRRRDAERRRAARSGAQQPSRWWPWPPRP